MTLNLLLWSTTITHLSWSWSTMQNTFISTQLFNFLQPFHIASMNQMLNRSFISNTIIVLSYNLSKYIQHKHIWKLFDVVVYINILSLLCISWIGMKSCSRFLHILVTTVHFMDQNWISKIFYCDYLLPICPHFS